MTKLDLRKELKRFYTAKRKPEMIDAPEGMFLTILGKGDPNGEEYQQAMMALYGVSYTLKFSQKAEGRDYNVMHLEGLWWVDGGVFDLNDPAPREQWRWKSMIRQPDFVTGEMVEEIRPSVREKRGAMVDQVKLESFHEGLCGQVMHVGPYSEEGPTIQLLHDYITEQGYRMRGDHHEIYMSDPRRSKPEKLKTIIRHPIEKC
ncbi:MAG TPA: GyrI-like domain-containing protein [Candidatus Krumholzibacteriaceae bacterium]|nr:GyrI-like domain-containing protein [Candidatus Krumholzibacteriaceae bacterium]